MMPEKTDKKQLVCHCGSDRFHLLLAAAEVYFSNGGATIEFRCLDEEVNREATPTCTECDADCSVCADADQALEGAWDFRGTLTDEYRETLEGRRPG